jgi:CRP-like cAMP-binding protein
VPEAAAELSAAEIRRLPAGSSSGVEAFSGVAFLVVETGFVVIRRMTKKRRGVVVCHAGSGALLSVPEPGEALVALADARVTLVSEATFDKLLAQPRVAILLSDAMRSELRQKRDSIANFASVRPVDRVERKLLQLAREHGRVVPGGIRLDFPITHELLGEMVGSARETVSRAIERLERGGFVVREGRSYRLQIEPETLATEI